MFGPSWSLSWPAHLSSTKQRELARLSGQPRLLPCHCQVQGVSPGEPLQLVITMLAEILYLAYLTLYRPHKATPHFAQAGAE